MTVTIPQTERPLRLLVLASADVVHTQRWVSYFRARGHEVRLATLEPTRGLELEEQVLPTRLIRPQFLRYSLAAPSVARLVHRFRPDLVNAHYVPGYGFLAALVRTARPLAVSCWGSDVLVNAGRSPLHRLRASVVMRAGSLFTCDAAVLAQAVAAFGVDESRILQAPLGVDRKVFFPDSVPPEDPAPRRGGPGRPLRILSTRRLEPIYCVETLLRAALILREAGWNFSLGIVGEGSERPSLEHFAGYYSLADRLSGFRGWLAPAELAAELRAADIYVSGSRSDGASVSLLEAMACGAFPVLSDIPGNREWIEDGVNGLLFPAGDSGRLSECLRRAMTDHELRRKARGRNLQIVQERALWERNMQTVEERFIALAASGQAGEPSRGRQNGQNPVERS